jgi:hypothetical protein
VLALEAVRAMKPTLDFLTPLAFAVILLTNCLVLVAAVRAKDLVLEVASAPVAVEPAGTTLAGIATSRFIPLSDWYQYCFHPVEISIGRCYKKYELYLGVLWLKSARQKAAK